MRVQEGALPRLAGAAMKPSMKWWPLRSTWRMPSRATERQVLLHRQARLRRQVLGRHEVAASAVLAFQTRQRARLISDL